VTAGVIAALAAAAVALTGCTVSEPPDQQIPTGVQPPPQGAGFDYQLGGAYDPPADAVVVARDSTASPPSTGYAICYVNGFQTQPGESAHWLAEHPDLVLRDAAGAPLADPGWPDEYLLDTSTENARMQIAALLGTVIAGCATSGFDAVEIDNLDSFTRSDGALTIEDNIDLAARYAEVAHSLGLAIAQKNGAGDSARYRDEVGFDFVVSEQCMRYDECADYLDAYDGLVLDIEYDDADAFAGYCGDQTHPPSMIRRDHDLSTPDDADYVYETC
jgi:hypothetical protein